MSSISRDEYYAASASGARISFHALLDFFKNGKEYKRHITGEVPQPAPTREMFIGTATHALILEGRAKYDAEYTIADGPINPKTGAPYGKETKAFRDWLAEQQKPIITTEEAAQIEAMNAAVREHAIAAQLLAQGSAENVVTFQWCELPCQSMIDWINPAFAIIDLKTCADIDRFVWQARDARYIAQLAFYRHALEATTGQRLECYIIAVEKAARPRCGVYMIPSPDLDEAEDWLMTQLNALADARESGLWRDGYEDLRMLTLHN